MQKYRVLATGCLAIILGLCCVPGWAKTVGAPVDQKKPRLVMVEIPSWKTAFFGLPRELPLLIRAGEDFESRSRQYDFSEGMEAMRVFLALRPKDKHAAAYNRFIRKWPHYQQFFQAVEQESNEQAQSQLEAIKAIDPKEPAVHFYFGSLYTHMKQYALAEKNYQQCLDLYPQYGPAYINLARLAMARGDKQAVRQYLETALEKLKTEDQGDARQIAQKMLRSLDSK